MKNKIKLTISLCYFVFYTSVVLGGNYPTTGSVERLDDAINKLIPINSKIEILAEGYVWSEGPVWVPGGDFLLYSDVPTNKVYKWKEGEGASIYLDPSGYTSKISRPGESGSNGLALDTDGRLILCQHGDRRVARMKSSVLNPKSDFVTLTSDFNGAKFNSPNDLAYNKKGELYFTDPPYGLVQKEKDPKREIDYQGVFLLRKNGKVDLVTKDLERPNGIILSPDEKTLYVANSHGPRPIWMSYKLNKNGLVKKGKTFFDSTDYRKKHVTRLGGNDGMKVDVNGNLWATGPGGVLVFSPQGKHLGTILTGQRTANCAFGDDGSTLYITADMYLMRIRTSVKGNGF
ncbi:MAG: SMP-30/gluconolactonase/LRE family protein [Opitutae bacterium]|jgi:gluconolactonase|nr:SMP-30/gluconolactonase/LRE family protein [Opitutae bacterium]MBT5717285.1 SMP-30/gluconolactonase/LRE family protein [Opitutae bacterium]